jgi:WD40 repeat protein
MLYKKIPFLLFSIFGLWNFISAQVPDAVINLGIKDFNSSCYTYADASGNIYLVGRAYYALDFDPGPDVVEAGPPDNQVFVVKYNSAFEILWLAHIEHATILNADATFLTEDGGIIISGAASSDPVIYGTSGTETLIVPNGLAAYFVRFNADGAIISSQAIGGPNGASSVYVKGISLDASDNITIAGSYIGNVDFDPSAAAYLLSGSVTDPYGFIAKYEASGNMIWAKKIGAGMNSVSVNDMATDSEGNLILVGYFAYTVDFNLDPLVTNNFTALDVYDGFIAKYNADGNYLWAGGLRENESYGGVSHVITDHADNIIIEGVFARKCDFDITAGIKNRKPSGADFYIAKYDPAGNYKWVKNPTGDGDFIMSQIAADEGGNIYSTGQFSGTFDFDFGNPIFNMSGPDAASWHANLFVTKMDKKGNFKYAFQLSPVFAELTGHGAGMSLSVTPDDQLLLTGTYDGSLDIDPTAGENIINEVGYDHTGFVARYGQPVLKSASAMPLPELEIYPSPASEYFVLDGSSDGLSSIFVSDMQGRVIKSWTTAEISESGLVFNVSGILPGSYLVTVVVNGVESSRLIQIIR